MKTFSFAVKGEILECCRPEACCEVALLSGIFKAAGSLLPTRQGLAAAFSTENFAVARRAADLADRLFGLQSEIAAGERPQLAHRTVYTLTAPAPVSETMLADLGILAVENGQRVIRYGLDPYLVEQNCCAAAFLAGVFLAAGSLTVPFEGGAGYHLECAVSDGALAQDVKQLLRRFEIDAKLTRRKELSVVYIKDGGSISDFLALCGCSKAVMALQDVMLVRGVKNNVNRRNNCFMANTGKAVSAAMRQLAAIAELEKRPGLDALPPPLREAALLRQEYPDESLDGLAQLSGGTIGKSGLRHRLDKLIALAAQLSGGEGDTNA